MKEYFLKSTVKAEPLIWRWYAWPYLIPPVTAGCNIIERHLKIMQSYVQNPQIHAQAVKDPKMLGGPFIDLEGKFVDEIKELIEWTKSECADLISLSNAIKEANKLLQNEATGGSVEEIYKKLPSNIRGHVELVYDLNHHPSLRLIEPTLYKTYYDDRHQEIALSDTISDYRKFVLSTPRLYQDDEVYLKVPFADKRLDTLFLIKEQPCDLQETIDLFAIPEEKIALFKSLFTTTAPNKIMDNNYEGEGIRIRYFGHACLLVQTKSTSILFDPVISYPINSEVPRYTFQDLPDQIDYVIITHNHQDHLMFETLLQLRHKIRHIVIPRNLKGSLEDPSIKLILKHIGFNSIIELDEMDDINFENGKIIALPFLGEHADLNIQTKLSYCINIQGKQFMFAADSNNLDEALYENIFKIIGPVDMLFVGMECDGAPLTWLYGPLLTTSLSRVHDRSRTLSGSNFDKAWSIVNILQCKHAYVYAMGKEPWLNYVMALDYSNESKQIIESSKFVQACKEKGIESERLFGKKEWIIER
ncbi:MBL fold metallo-hydrolase [Rickettsiales endosymbiont of Stachyamoeba lipophora]|uniref:MBL fold metallo-hydrolase n=1 Tax=Rickettsiales endosymbiont of Stachyamoeba lipophora TaxID=2486578 RepID=UPI000F6460B2|nr:MBL fold metallo-hydrolase [Rickettsiales endosymbiont of Stachyamoeba lipophora]AZL16328.1 MBL fold metallo-hydrolase [Rickettsiales endosymbiont of Stachyamoeba lipophora]